MNKTSWSFGLFRDIIKWEKWFGRFLLFFCEFFLIVDRTIAKKGDATLITQMRIRLKSFGKKRMEWIQKAPGIRKWKGWIICQRFEFLWFTDRNLNIKAISELDDSSHDKPERKDQGDYLRKCGLSGDPHKRNNRRYTRIWRPGIKEAPGLWWTVPGVYANFRWGQGIIN